MNVSKVDLTPAELKAIEEHKYYLSQKRGEEVSIEEATEDFLATYADQWKRERVRRDNLDQIQEIEKHKYLRSKEQGRDIGKNVAAEEWCKQYAHIWRAERESLARNGFLRVRVAVKDPLGLHMRPTSAIASLATRYDCDIYVHKANMPYYNFILQGKPYMNVKSILGLLSLEIILGDALEFIATGAQAKEALDDIVREIESVRP